LAFIPFVLYASWIVFKLLCGEEKFGESFKKWPIGPVIDIATISTCTLTAIIIYSLNFYGEAKPQFGGGLPANVRVIISDEKRIQLDKLGGVERVEQLLNNARLIEVSDQDYIVALKTEDGGERLLQLDRTMVDAILYLQ
jgi:hypothetical protein